MIVANLVTPYLSESDGILRYPGYLQLFDIDSTTALLVARTHFHPASLLHVDSILFRKVTSIILLLCRTILMYSKISIIP